MWVIEMTKWEKLAIGVGLYAAGAIGATVFFVVRGSNGKPVFDGFTGNESEGVKAAEAIGLWFISVPYTLVKGGSS